VSQSFNLLAPVFTVDYLSAFVQTVILNQDTMVIHHDKTKYCYLRCISSTQPFLAAATGSVPLLSAVPHT